jgi:hypothetical protein
MLFIKKPYLDLEKKFKDIMSLHKKDLADHFVRLEKISKSNLVYYQYYENLKTHFQAIEQDVYPKAQQAMDQLLKLVKEHQNKSFNL